MVFVMVLSLYSTMCYANTYIVPVDFNGVQDAINSSNAGDTITVLPGRYYEQIDYMGKNVVIISRGGPDSTILDGNDTGTVVKLVSGEVSSATLSGFTITGGYSPSNSGGGILINGASSPVIANNIIKENTGKIGGGIAVINGSKPIIVDNLIMDNRSTMSGGGIYLSAGSDATILSNTFLSNISEKYEAGGITCYASSPSIGMNTFRDNHGIAGAISCKENSNPDIHANDIENNFASHAGGGIVCRTGSSPHIYENTIVLNKAFHSGGGILALDSSPVIEANTIEDNVAGYDNTIGYGGGIACFSNSSAVITDNEINNNHAQSEGGGVTSTLASPTITDNTISGNSASGQPGYGFGGGVFLNDSYAVVENNVITNNTTYYAGAGVYVEGDEATVYMSLVKGNTISHNVSDGDGGGFICTKNDSTIFTGNIVESNRAQHIGGGILVHYLSRAVIDSNRVVDNEAIEGGGGGITVIDRSNPTISRNLVEKNRALSARGGGINIHSNCSPLVTENYIKENEASGGGGIRCYWGSHPTITRNIFVLNTADIGGGILVETNSSSLIMNNTLIGNIAQNGSAVLVNTNSSATIVNNIVYGSTGDYCIRINTDLEVETNYNCFYLNPRGEMIGGSLGESNIFKDPEFIDLLEYNFNLNETSPCIDAGNPSSPLDPDSTISDVGRFYFEQAGGIFVNDNETEDLPSMPVPLLQNYPNPFNPVTTIVFEVDEEAMNDEAGLFDLSVYDVRGKKIITLLHGVVEAGMYRCVWNGKDQFNRNVPSGIYLYRLTSTNRSLMKKMVLMR